MDSILKNEILLNVDSTLISKRFAIEMLNDDFPKEKEEIFQYFREDKDFVEKLDSKLFVTRYDSYFVKITGKYILCENKYTEVVENNFGFELFLLDSENLPFNIQHKDLFVEKHRFYCFHGITGEYIYCDDDKKDCVKNALRIAMNRYWKNVVFNILKNDLSPRYKHEYTSVYLVLYENCFGCGHPLALLREFGTIIQKNNKDKFGKTTGGRRSLICPNCHQKYMSQWTQTIDDKRKVASYISNKWIE